MGCGDEARGARGALAVVAQFAFDLGDDAVDEEGEEGGVELPLVGFLAKDGAALGDGAGAFVGAVFGGEGVEDVADGEDADLGEDGVGADAFGVAGAVELFVVVASDAWDAG